MDASKIEREMIGDLWVSPELWNNLLYLCDACNGRFAGTEDERRAGDYMMARLKEYGLQNVHAEPFEMRGWERGPARLCLLDGQREIELTCIGLPGTHPCDLTAEIIDVGTGTEADFQRLGSAVAGKIVMTNAEGPARGDKYQAASEAGAVAFIFATGQPGMLPPTGSINGSLPAIGLAQEGAARIKRMLEAGPVRGRLTIDAKLGTVTARNIVAEIPGTDPDAGWILTGGHYDGHDVAQGAFDNAIAAVALMEAARLLSPRREHLKAGIRFIFFSGEEMGLYGSWAYAREHAEELDQARLMFNVDVVGLAMPLMLHMQASPEVAAYLRSLPLKEIDAVVEDGPRSFIMHSDHFPFVVAGLQSTWALTSRPPVSFGWGHSAADTIDKLEPRVVRQTAISVLRLLLQMAGDPKDLPHGRRSPETVRQILTDAGFEKPMRASGKWPF